MGGYVELFTIERLGTLAPQFTRHKSLTEYSRYIEAPAQSKIGVIQLLVLLSGAMIVSSSAKPVSLLNG